MIPQDAIARYYLPETAAQWTELLAGSGIEGPAHLALCQEPAGDLADSIGGLVLEPAGTVLYQQAAPGFARKGVSGTGAAGRFGSTSFVDPSVTSVTVLLLVALGAIDSSARDVVTIGAGSDTSILAYDNGSGRRLRYRENNNLADTDLANPTVPTSVFPLIVTIDVTLGRATYLADHEHRYPAYGPPSAVTHFALGSFGGTWAACTILYAAIWTGAAAEVTDAQRVELRRRLEAGPSAVSFPTIANATTETAIRDRVIDLVEAIAPAAVPGTKFRRYRHEGDGVFTAWCEANPQSSFRRFSVRFDGADETPESSNCDHETRHVTIITTIAYPHDGRAGAKHALDRDSAIRLDTDKLKLAIGLYGRANFTSPDACWVAGDAVRVPGDAVDFLVATNTYRFRRSLTL